MTETKMSPEELSKYQRECTDGMPVLYKLPYAGMAMQGFWVVGVDKDDDAWSCTAGTEPGHPEDCIERWSTMWALPGDSLEEAHAALARQEFLGPVYHVNDCELVKEKPRVEL